MESVAPSFGFFGVVLGVDFGVDFLVFGLAPPVAKISSEKKKKRIIKNYE